MKPASKTSVFLFILLAAAMTLPSYSAAHCDTMDGPVVSAAQVALEKRDVTPVLMWVKEQHENEIRSTFERTLSIRQSGKGPQEIADRHFFETLVRLHREGEGESYTGLKPAGSDIPPIVKAADEAIVSGSVEEVREHIISQIQDGIGKRFSKTLEKNHHAKESVRQGREYVESYVEFMHYVEKLAEMAEGPAAHGHGHAQEHNAHKEPKHADHSAHSEHIREAFVDHQYREE